MSFLIGLGILIPIVIVFNYLNKKRMRLSKEFALVPLFVMLFIDALIVFMFYNIFADMVTDEHMFRKGIAGGFAVSTFLKCGILIKWKLQ